MSRLPPVHVLLAMCLGLTAAAASSAPAVAAGDDVAPGTSIVVQLDPAAGATVDDLEAEFPVRVDSALLATRGIYLLRPTDAAVSRDEKQTAKLAGKIDHSKLVRYAEPNYETRLSDSRYHGWPEGDPVVSGASTLDFQNQPLTSVLGLPGAHAVSTGAGAIVAVLDTGVDAGHPALAGHLAPGYDYVDDDPDPSEQASGIDTNENGIVDEAYGHGTFVAGIVGLVAPQARILPMRVLDSDGEGSEFAVVQALLDAVDAGADVINLSLGTAAKTDSKLMDDAVKYAKKHGTLVVAAAGNAGSSDKQYPAEDNDVLSVTSLDPETDQLSTYASWGDWVDVAAPASLVLGPLPGGRYAWWTGTSMAAPQVSGQAALIWAKSKDRSQKRQFEAITRSSRRLRAKAVHYGAIDLAVSLVIATRK